jgi:hypothetical protein
MISPKTLEQSVRDWLETQGFPFEMEVAAMLRDNGFDVVQSSYFLDATTGKYRELDVVAFRSWSTTNVQWQITLIVECKVTKPHPWVTFTRDLTITDTEGQFQYYRTPASKLGRQLLTKIRRHQPSRGKLPLLDFISRPGYGIQRALLNAPKDKQEKQTVERRDVAFESAAKVANAARSRQAIIDSEEYADTPIGEIVLPVIAVDGDLVDVYRQSHKRVVVAPIDDGILDWSNPVAGRPPTWVRIVTSKAMGDFAAKAKKSCDYLEKGCKKQLEELDKQWMAKFENR